MGRLRKAQDICKYLADHLRENNDRYLCELCFYSLEKFSMKMKIYNKRQFKYPKQDIHSLFTRCGNDAYHFITESLIAHCKEENILEENIACLVCEEKSGGGQSTRSSSDRPGGSQTPNQFVYSRSPPFYIQNLLAKSEASRKRTRALQVSGSVPSGSPFTNHNLSIIFVGLRGAGKRTLMWRWAHPDRPIPRRVPRTTELIVRRSRYRCLTSESLTELQNNFSGECAAIVFIYDSADPHSLVLSQELFNGLVRSEAMRNTPIAFICNKVDLQTAQLRCQMLDSFMLYTIETGWPEDGVAGITMRRLAAFRCAAKDGTGCQEAYEFLKHYVRV